MKKLAKLRRRPGCLLIGTRAEYGRGASRAVKDPLGAPAAAYERLNGGYLSVRLN